jgi:signal transduction histidine kinase/ActR/RegA family two-component response regulator
MSRVGRLGWTPLVTLVFGLVVAVGAFGIVRSVSTHDETQLLRQRAAELKATLLTSIQTANASLGILGVFADPKSPRDPADFERAAGSLLKPGVKTVSLVTPSGSALKVAASIGVGPKEGEVLTGDREAVARRALSAGKLTAAMFRDGDEIRIAFAVPAALGNAVVYQETALDPSRPIPVTKDSPYHELRVALYAGPRPNASQLILSTESSPFVSGRTVTSSLPVGADTWSLVVGTRQPLAGGFAGKAPWLVLGMGVLLALLASAVVGTQVRRRAYALALVDSTTRELKVIKEFLEQLFAKGPVVVLRGELVAGEVLTTYVSPNLETVFQIDPSEVVTAGSLMGWVHPDDAAAADVIKERTVNASVQQSVEFRVRQPDGSYRWASATTLNEVDDDGVGSFGVYLIDISMRRAAQDAVREALEEAQDANRSKTEFLSRVSHELRTPLNAIIGFGQLVRDSSTGHVREDTEHILKAGKHLLDLINEVLDISRIESGDLGLSPEPVAVDELLGEAIDLIRPIAETQGIHIAADGCKSCHFYAFADRQRTKQIVLNLLSNAVKYNRPMGTVAVSCAQAGDGRLLVKIVDTGPGISPEFAEAVFAPFERLGAANSDVEGTGIGLALSRRLAEAMGGTLTLESVLREGSTFTLDLPLVEGPVERFERLDRPASAPPPATNGSATRKVLYIEDNLSNLRLIERVLTRRPDVSLVSAMQGRLGLALAREHLPIMILLDLHLADIGGEEILSQLLADPLTASIPVVIVSADATPGQIGRLLAAGAVAYLTKPIDIDQLLHEVDAASSRRDERLLQEVDAASSRRDD